MHKVTRFSSLLTLVSLVYVILATGCGTRTAHPNQLNSFDGATFDSLTLAHAALTSLRVQVGTSYPKYIPEFNEAAAAYATAYSAYAVYRTNPVDSSAMTVAMGNLTVNIVALENTFQTDMQVSPSVVAGVHDKSRTLLQKAARQNITVSDILTDLEIAAAIARSIPGASAYARLAAFVVAATSEALAAETAESGQPIDLTTIQPVSAI